MGQGIASAGIGFPVHIASQSPYCFARMWTHRAAPTPPVYWCLITSAAIAVTISKWREKTRLPFLLIAIAFGYTTAFEHL